MADLVAISLPQDNSLVNVLADVWEAGDAACIIDPRLSATAQTRALATLKPTVMADQSGRHRLEGGQRLEPGDALCVMTSGSTADPKAAILTHEAVRASAQASSTALRIDPTRHKWLACLPVAHIGGLSVITRALVTGTAVDVIDRPDLTAIETALGRGVTHVSLVATALQRLHPERFERILLGGAAPPSGLPHNVVTTYGMTETGSGVVYDGFPLDGVRLAIDTPDESGLGEILVTGPMLLRSYRDRPAPFVTGPDSSGAWLATGDLGRLNEDGKLEVRGRRTEVITTGAEKVFPGDVERVLAGLPGIRELAIWKRPDEVWGERVVAFIVPEGTAPSLDQIKELVSDQIAPYAAPKEVVIVDTLPRTESGKIRRALLDG